MWSCRRRRGVAASCPSSRALYGALHRQGRLANAPVGEFLISRNSAKGPDADLQYFREPRQSSRRRTALVDRVSGRHLSCGPARPSVSHTPRGQLARGSRSRRATAPEPGDAMPARSLAVGRRPPVCSWSGSPSKVCVPVSPADARRGGCRRCRAGRTTVIQPRFAVRSRSPFAPGLQRTSRGDPAVPTCGEERRGGRSQQSTSVAPSGSRRFPTMPGWRYRAASSLAAPRACRQACRQCGVRHEAAASTPSLRPRASTSSAVPGQAPSSPPPAPAGE